MYLMTLSIAETLKIIPRFTSLIIIRKALIGRKLVKCKVISHYTLHWL